MKLKELKKSTYFSYGIDVGENEEEYWYLQTANNGYEDFEILNSKNRYVPLLVGKFLSLIFNKRLVKW